MTRFLMPMSEAINLVIYAMKNAKNGDILVKKTFATTIKTLSETIIKFMNKKNWKVKIIGNRHGEKKHESLLSAEELSKAIDLKNFYRIPSDIRDLNYKAYFDQGKNISKFKTYSSDNVKNLNQKELLKVLNYIRKDLI